ncbi:MAG: hypothetical protein ACP5IT_04755 [Thermoproteota archaeon]
MKLDYVTLLKIVIVAAILAFLGSWIASYAYEPLDKAAEMLNLKEVEIFKAPLSGYTLGWRTINLLGYELDISGVIAGIVGTLVVLILAYALANILSRKKS